MSSTGTGRAAGPGDHRTAVALLVLGVGLGGFVDGIVLHQILQWHHMTTATGDEPFPATDVGTLEADTRWDGAFHTATWVLVVVGLVLLWRALASGRSARGRTLVGLLAAGWGVFNVVEGLVDHHLLTLHHVRDDVADPRWWDVGFLALGAALVLGGWAMWRSERTRP